MAQKSCPSGAPARAATASIALTPGDDCYIHLAPFNRSALQCFAYRGSHSKYAGIAAGDDGHCLPFSGGHQRLLSALKFLPVVGRVAALRRSFRDPIQIRTVSEYIVGVAHYSFCFRRQLVRIPRPEANDGQFPCHVCHQRLVTNTMAKYGAESSVFSANGIRRSLCMVPRST